jgi:hypothetical protein
MKDEAHGVLVVGRGISKFPHSFSLNVIMIY